MKKRISPDLKSKVVLEALRQNRTMTEIASTFGVSPSQIVQWKKVGLEHLKGAFSNKRSSALEEHKELVEVLYGQVGRLKVENEWLKKKLGC